MILIALGYGSFLVYKLNYLEKKVSVKDDNSRNFFDTLKSLSINKPLELKGVDKKRINILFLGLPGKGKPGQNLTDTIMVASINLETNQVALLSIPRDFYVEIPHSHLFTKINSVYQYEQNQGNGENAADTLKEIVENITSLNINYYVVVNFDGFTQIIDALGEINITSERDIYDSRYPGPNYSYEIFELKKGFHTLNGATALKYARERHDDPEGDFGRAKRQQQILQATKNKIFTTQTMLNVSAINELFNVLGNNIKTDISPEEFDDFLELIKRVDTNNINNVVLDAWNKDSLLKVSHVFYGNVRAFVLVPRVGNYSEIHDLAQDIFDLNKIRRRKEAISQENSTIALLNKSGDKSLTDKIKKLLSDNFGYKNVIIIQDVKDKKLGQWEKETVAYDFTSRNKPFTLDEIVTRLPAKATGANNNKYQESVQNISADILVVIGQDLIEKYKMEEDNIEEYNKAEETNEYQELLKQ